MCHITSSVITEDHVKPHLDGTQEDMVMQLLVLKLLYLIFTTKGTTEYFYTNDLCVLVDVFLREILNLDESNESVSPICNQDRHETNAHLATTYLSSSIASTAYKNATSG